MYTNTVHGLTFMHVSNDNFLHYTLSSLFIATKHVSHFFASNFAALAETHSRSSIALRPQVLGNLAVLVAWCKNALLSTQDLGTHGTHGTAGIQYGTIYRNMAKDNSPVIENLLI